MASRHPGGRQLGHRGLHPVTVLCRHAAGTTPFYGFFTIRALEKIDFDTGLDSARQEGCPTRARRDLASFLRTPLGRARARGHPPSCRRATTGPTSSCSTSSTRSRSTTSSVRSCTWSMILTPYYQDRIRQLPPAQRKIVEFLCLRGRPATIKDIATPLPHVAPEPPRSRSASSGPPDSSVERASDATPSASSRSR